MKLLTQPNTRPSIKTFSSHTHVFSDMCPVSHNPQVGSVLTVSYRPTLLFLEVNSFAAYLTSYRGGKGDIRDMEGMIQQIAQDCADVIRVRVTAKASILLQRDSMQVIAIAYPEKAQS